MKLSILLLILSTVFGAVALVMWVQNIYDPQTWHIIFPLVFNGYQVLFAWGSHRCRTDPVNKDRIIW
jgi:hypothetical protein